jgi:hypothetical protein
MTLSAIVTALPGRTEKEILVFSNNSEPMTRGTYSRAFVIKFSDETDLFANVAAGRVEHVSSGNKIEFQSIPQLIAFMDLVLKQARSGSVA